MQTRESHLLDSDGTYNKRQKTCNDSIWELIKYVAAFDKLKDLDFNFKVGASFD